MLSNIDLKIFKSVPKLGQDLSDSFSECAVNYIIPGGTTCPVVMEAIKASKADLSQSNIFLTDDRVVPHDLETSNFGQLKKLVPNDNIKIFSWTTPEGLLLDIKEISRLRELIESAPIELILGVGDDGHIASLFPTDNNFHEGLFQKIIRRNEDNFLRFSLSMPFLLKSDDIKIVFFGKRKKQVFKYIKLNDKSVPIVRFLCECNNLGKSVTIYTTYDTCPNYA